MRRKGGRKGEREREREREKEESFIILSLHTHREGWEAKALLEFYDAKTKAKEMLKSRGGMSGGGGGGGGRRNQPPRRRFN